MNFIYTSDIHGDKKKYETILKLAQKEKIENIVMGGDILPKNYKRRELIQREFINGYLKEYYQKLQEENIKMIGILGNDDVESIEEEYYHMIAEYPNIIDIDNKKYDTEEISFMGMNKVLDTPFMRKDHVVIEKNQNLPEQRSDEIYIDKGRKVISKEEWYEMRRQKVPTMEESLKKLPQKTKGKKAIYIFHDPPYGLGLDYCKDGDRPGSKAIREFLKEKDCYMSLHGHIHESPQYSGYWYNYLGKTMCIQPGQTEYGEETTHCVIVDTKNDICKLKHVKEKTLVKKR